MRKFVGLMVLVMMFCCVQGYAVQRFVIDGLSKDQVSWKSSGEIVIFDFTFKVKKGKVKIPNNPGFFKVDTIHEGLWLLKHNPELSGSLPKGVGYRIIAITTDGKLLNGKVSPSLDKNAKPGSADDILSQAMAAYKIGNFKESMPLFMKVYNTFPKHRAAPFSIFMSAQSLCALKRFKESSALFSALIKKYPSSKLVPAAFFRIGCISISFLDKEQEGRAYFNLIMKNFPNSKYAGEAIFNVSALNLIQGKVKAAVAGFNELIKRFPAHYRTPVAKKTLADFAATFSGKK